MHAAQTSISRSEPSADPKYPPASKLVSAWARGRRRLTPWAYPRLRAIAAVRFVIAILLTGVGAVMLARGYGEWAGAAPLAVAALHFSIACLDSAAARSAPRGALASCAHVG